MNRRILGMTLIMTSFLMGPHLARADLPENRNVYFYVHETPNDPESDIVFAVELVLEAADADGDWVGWDVTSAEFTQAGTPDIVWNENSPSVDSPDGLWWVEHSDPQDPLHSEFVLPPLLEGTAIAADQSNEDLEYTLEGVSYSPPPGGPPFDATSSLDFAFTLEGESQPEESGEDEVVDTPDGVRDIH